MTATTISSINLFPINFQEFETINKITNNVEATLLLSKLKFHQTNSKIRKFGKIYIIRSRKQISSWFGYSMKKTDRILSYLEKIKLIEKKPGLWYGRKRLFISVSEKVGPIPVNLKILDAIIEKTGSIQNALVFSKIFFSFSNSKIEHEKIKWCCLKKEILSNWIGVSIRTIDSILKDLYNKGLILKKNFIRNTKLQSHFHIPKLAIDEIKNRIHENRQVNVKSPDYEKTPFNLSDTAESQLKQNLLEVTVVGESNTQNFREQPAKMETSIKIRKNFKKTNNNTTYKILNTSASKMVKTLSDITLDRIGENLTSRQIKYLKSAIRKTISRNKIKISNPKELFEEIKFSILNKQQRRDIISFKHSVSRFMKILKENKWKTPIGFYKYSPFGIEKKKNDEEEIKKWEKSKLEEKNFYKSYENIFQKSNISNIRKELTDKAIFIAKKVFALSNGIKNVKEAVGNFLIKQLINEIEELVKKGADRYSVINCLKGAL